jgi:hypothetical protein
VEHPRSMRRRMLAVAVTAAFAVAGCSTSPPAAASAPPSVVPSVVASIEPSAPPSATAAKLSFLTFETPALDAAFWDNSIQVALKQVPGLTIDKIVTPGADRNGYAKQLQASGQFPDILASINPRDFLEAGLLEPFDQAWLDSNFVLPNANAIKAKSYIPPTNSQIIPLVFYNKDLFATNNISVPTNYAEFVAAVTKLKAAKVVPIEFAGAEPWSASMVLVGLASADVLGKDPQWIQKRYAGSVKFSDPLFANAMKKAQDLIDKGAFGSAALSVDFATANKNFLDGKSGMYPMGSWFTGSGYMTAEQAAHFGAFPFPTDDGSLVVPFNVGGTTAVSTKSADVAAAMKFAQAWSLAPENLKVLIESDGAYPMMKTLTLDQFGATTSTLYKDTYGLVTSTNTKVSSFGWVNNDDSLAPGINDAFYALSQGLFSNKDLSAQLTQLDTDWDTAAK